MAFNRLAAGKKVYRNGSHAPTRGRNKPKGYIKREQRKKKQHRSGLAKAALRRMRKRDKANGPKYGPKGHLLKKYRKPKKKAVAKKPVAKKAATPPPRVGSPPVVTPPEPPAPANPYIEINANGQLDLPYNEQYSWDVLDQTQAMNKSLLDLQQSQQSQQNEYNIGLRDLGKQQEESQLNTLNNASSRGLAQSSMYGKDVAESSTEFNNARTDLDTANNAFQQNAQLSRMTIQNQFNDMLRQSGLKNAEAQAGNAGNLGYGQATATPAPLQPHNPVALQGPRVPAARPKAKPKARRAAAVRRAGVYRRKHGNLKGFKGSPKVKQIARKRAAARRIKRRK